MVRGGIGFSGGSAGGIGGKLVVGGAGGGLLESIGGKFGGCATTRFEPSTLTTRVVEPSLAGPPVPLVEPPEPLAPGVVLVLGVVVLLVLLAVVLELAPSKLAPPALVVLVFEPLEALWPAEVVGAVVLEPTVFELPTP